MRVTGTRRAAFISRDVFLICARILHFFSFKIATLQDYCIIAGKRGDMVEEELQRDNEDKEGGKGALEHS